MVSSVTRAGALLLLAGVLGSCRHELPAGPQLDRNPGPPPEAGVDGPASDGSLGTGDGNPADGTRLDRPGLPPDQAPPDTRPHQCKTDLDCVSGPCGIAYCDPDGICQLKPAGAGTTCRPSAGPCDAAESCTGSSTSCPGDTFLSGKVCRPAAGACDREEVCSGSSPACPADGFLSGVCRPAAGVCDKEEVCSGSSAACPPDGFLTGSCRGSTGPCDPAESCSGSSAGCPADVTWATQQSTYLTTWGNDGFVGQTTMGYQRVEATCFDEGGTSVLNRGFVSFDTGPLPDQAAIISAELTACYDGGPGGELAELYSSSFSLPIAMSAFNAPAQLLKQLPNLTGNHTEAVPASSVKTTGPTQYSIRFPVTSCPGGWYGKRWGSSTGPVMSHCPASSPWQLKVTYCAP